MTERLGTTASGGLIQALRDHRDAWWAIAAIVVLSLAAALLEGLALVLVVPLTEAVATGSTDVGGTLGGLVDTDPRLMIGAGIASAIGAAAARVVATAIQVRRAGRVENAEKRRAFRAYLNADQRSQQAERSGRMIEVVNRAHGRVDRLYNLIGTLKALASVAVLVIGAIIIQPQGAGAIVLVGAALFFAFRPLVTRSRAASAETTAALAPVAEHLAEVEAGRTEVRSFGAVGWATDRFGDVVDRLTAARFRQLFLGGLLTPLYQGAALAGIFAVLAVARASPGMDVASLGAVALLLLRSLSYGQAFQSSYQKLNEAAAVSDWFLAAVERLEASKESFGTAHLEQVEKVALDRVSFSYAERSPVLDTVSFELRAGDRVGLVGPSGAGKTTLAQVLLRLLVPTTGTYWVNGQPAGSYAPSSWTREVAFVPQQPRLLHGTVHQNIAMFRPEVERDDVVTAARNAALHEVIEGLPGGYDTEIGPSTRALSGGQVQRLGIARALLTGPSLLVLDEPTSALDSVTDQAVQTAIQGLRQDIIVVIIAHRMSTLQICERIIVLEEGTVVADDAPSNVAIESSYFAADGGARPDVAISAGTPDDGGTS